MKQNTGEADQTDETQRSQIKQNKQIKQSKQKALNFLMGQVMRITRGKADPGEIVKLLQEELDK